MLGFADDEAGRESDPLRQRSAAAVSTPSGAPPCPNHVHARADNSGGNAGGEVAVTDKPDACPAARISSMCFSWRAAIENDDHEIFDVAVERLATGAKVIGHGASRSTAPLQAGANNDFSMYKSGACAAAFFAGGKNDDGIGRAGGAEIVALSGSTAISTTGKRALGMSGEADLFADVEHGRFVALAFPMTMVPSICT